jgi:hypothetical protein
LAQVLAFRRYFVPSNFRVSSTLFGLFLLVFGLSEEQFYLCGFVSRADNQRTGYKPARASGMSEERYTPHTLLGEPDEGLELGIDEFCKNFDKLTRDTISGQHLKK